MASFSNPCTHLGKFIYPYKKRACGFFSFTGWYDKNSFCLSVPSPFSAQKSEKSACREMESNFFYGNSRKSHSFYFICTSGNKSGKLSYRNPECAFSYIHNADSSLFLQFQDQTVADYWDYNWFCRNHWSEFH